MSKYQGVGFSERLRHRARSVRSWLCVGLDPAVDRLPSPLTRDSDGVVEFCRALVDSTQHRTLCYKINFGFFEALGADSWHALYRVRECIPANIPVIADAKRGDVASTAAGYAHAIFEQLGFDAVTVSPYLGWDSLSPWTSYPDRGIFVLCKTSNPDAPHFQDLECDGKPLYLRVAAEARELESAADIGLVVGATYPESLARVRALDPDIVMLCPGVGAQGGGIREALQAGANAAGENLLVAVSRDVIYASPQEDYADAAARAAAERATATWTDAS